MIASNADELLPTVQQARAHGLTIVTTTGCFDLLHVGHLYVLRAAKQLGDVLVVGVNADERVRTLKGGGQPFVGEEQRAELVEALSIVEHSVIFAEDTPAEMLAVLKPDVHVKGEGWSVEGLPETQVVRAYGGRVEIVPHRIESTSGIISRIRASG